MVTDDKQAPLIFRAGVMEDQSSFLSEEVAGLPGEVGQQMGTASRRQRGARTVAPGFLLHKWRQDSPDHTAGSAVHSLLGTVLRERCQ